MARQQPFLSDILFSLLSLQGLLTFTQSNFDERPIDFYFPNNPQFFCAKPKEANAQIPPI